MLYYQQHATEILSDFLFPTTIITLIKFKNLKKKNLQTSLFCSKFVKKIGIEIGSHDMFALVDRPIKFLRCIYLMFRYNQVTLTGFDMFKRLIC